jgi:hypothetical protein
VDTRNDVTLYMNQAVNFFWTILSFIPVMGFWLGEGITTWFYIFGGISIISLFLPELILQLSDNPKFYEGIGVRFIRKFVQDGDLVKRFIKKGKPQSNIIKNKTNALSYGSTIVMYERYHFLCFVFFLLTTFYAVYTAKYPLSLIIIMANIIYNICPIMLQQYNRARLLKLRK